VEMETRTLKARRSPDGLGVEGGEAVSRRSKASDQARSAWAIWVGVLGILFATATVEAQQRNQPIPEDLNFANGLFRARQFVKAAEEYERFLQADPPDRFRAEALFGLANARHFLQEYEQARARFEAFLEVAPEDHPNRAAAQFRVGEMAHVLGDLFAAEEALTRFLEDHPDHRYVELALPYLGDVLYRLGEMDEAKAAYEKALKAYPEGRLSDRARLYLARTLLKQGEIEAALERFRSLAARPDASYRDQAYEEIGRLELEAGRFEAALEAFEAIEQEMPQSSRITRARLGKAEALIALERLDEAVALLEPMAEDPSPALASRAAYELGRAELQRGQAAEALAVFERALERDPEGQAAPAIRFRAAQAAEQLGETADARERYEDLAEQYSDDPWGLEAFVRAAALALKAGEPDEAIRLARQVPEDASNHARALLIEGRALLETGQAETAVERLQTLLDTAAASPETARAARYDLVRALQAAGREEQADQVLQGLANDTDAPESADALYLVGQRAFDDGRFEEAADALERYFDARPEGDVADHALARLAIARAELERPEESQEDLERLENTFPDSPVLRPTRLRLADLALANRAWDRAEALYRVEAEDDASPYRVRARSGLGWTLKGAGRLDEAAEVFQGLIDNDPNTPQARDARLTLARIRVEQGRPDEALAHFAASVDGPSSDDRADDTDAPESAEPLDGVLAEWGWAAIDAGRLDESDQVFQRLLDQFPDSPRAADARLNLAESAYQAGRANNVERLLEPLIAPEASETIEPRVRQAALYRAGRTAFDADRWDVAAERLERLQAEFPENPYRLKAQFLIAQADFETGDAEAAWERLKTVIAQAKDLQADGVTPEPWLPIARLRAIQALEELGRWSEALEAIQTLEAEAPEDVPLRAELNYAKGRALQSVAPPRFDEARAAYDRVLEAGVGGELAAMAQFMKGETYYHEKDYDEALRAFDKVAILYDAPKWQAMALLEAGKVYEQLDQWAEAAETYERLRSDFPEEPASAEADRRLAASRGRSGLESNE